MYLHVGGDYLIRKDKIIGIFDIENTSISKHTRDFFKKSENDKNVINVSYELPRSFILDDEERVYISPISPQTLLKRMSQKTWYKTEKKGFEKSESFFFSERRKYGTHMYVVWIGSRNRFEFYLLLYLCASPKSR